MSDSMQAVSTVNAAASGPNPYVGPRPFLPEDSHRYFGREREAADLLSQVLAERLVLFYAQSGAGKTSLINTQLRADLTAEGYHLLPIGRVSGDLPLGITAVDNIFTFNLLLRLAEERHPPQTLAGLTLAMYLTDLHFANAEQDPARPLVLIVDQFEEILTNHLDAWEKREHFFRQLRDALSAVPQLSVVLSLREDFVAGLDPYARLLPGKLRTRFYMQRMTPDAALQAIEGPVAQSRPFAPGVAQTLVENLRQIRVLGQEQMQPGQYVEPVQLQVVCFGLWANLPAADDSASAPPTIELEDLQAFGDVDSALAGYYTEAIHRVRDWPGLNVSERQLRDWFSNQLITADETRGLVRAGDETDGTGGLPNAAVRLLADQFLIRAESRAGGLWYELVHDRFVLPILQANRAWLLLQSNPVSVAMRLWLENGRDPARLLGGTQLADAQRYADENSQEVGKDERDFLEAGAKQQAIAEEEGQRRQLATAQTSAEEQRRRATSLRRLVIGVALLALVALIATGVAFRQSRVASQQAAAAIDAQMTAEAARVAASQQGDLAATRAAEAIAAVAESDQLRQQIRADQLAQKAQLTHIDTTLDHFPQRALLLVVEAARVISPPLPSALTALHDLLGRTGGKSLRGQEGAVRSVAFSGDGRWLASGSDDSSVRVWATADLSADPVVLSGHEGVVLSVAFSADGRWLASGSDDNHVRVWATADLSADPVVLSGHEGVVLSVAFSADGRWLASGSDDSSVRVWDTTDLSADPVVLSGPQGYVYRVAFSGDGRWLASGSDDLSVRMWDTTDLSTDPVVLSGQEGVVLSVAFSADGRWLASGSDDSSVRMWDTTDLSADPVVLSGQEGVVLSVAFSADGRWLASGSDDSSVRMWDTTDLSADPVVLSGQEGAVYSVAFSADGRWLASGSDDSSVRMWDMTDLSTDPVVLSGQEGWVTSVAFSGDGRWLASGSTDRSVRVWDTTDLSTDPVVLSGQEGVVLSVAFSADGRWLASGSDDSSVRMWDTTDLSTDPVVLSGQEGWVTSVAFSGDGRWLASGSDDSSVRMWDTTDLSADPVVLSGQEGAVYSVAFSADGRWLASGSDDSSVRMWDTTDLSTDPVVLSGQGGAVYSVAFSGDGRWLASGSDDSSVRMWDTTDLSADPVVLSGHEGAVYSVAFSADGRWLASGSDDSSVRMWDTTDLSADPVVLSGHEGAVYSVAFSADGRWLASGSDDSSVRVWITTVDRLLDLACITAGRNLSREEWTRYFPKERPHLTCPTLPWHVSYLAYAADLAAGGEITAAVAAYQEALDLDPTLAITPTLEANRQYAATVVAQANQLAASGEITQAVTAYQEALGLDPTLAITPTLEANRRYAATVVAQANQLAVSGEIMAAVAAYQEALDLDPTLGIDPQVEAHRPVTQPLLDAMAARGAVMTNTQTLDGIFQAAIHLADELNDNSLRLQICQTGQISMAVSFVLSFCQQVVATARELTGTTAISAVVTSQAGDLWKFSGQAGQVVTIWLRASASNLDAYLRLYDPSFALLAEADDSDNTDAALEAIHLAVDGVYLINADGYGNSTGAYVLDIVIEDETE